MMKSCFLGWKEIQFRRSRWFLEVLTRKIIFQKRITQQGLMEEDLLWSGGREGGFSSSGKLKLQFIRGRKKAADYVNMLNDLSLAQERRLCGEGIFQQDNAAIHNASITKYKTSWPPSMLSRPQSNRKLVGTDCCKSLWRRSTVLSYFWNQKWNFRSWEKYLRFNFRN